jgi:hypothetical protein
MYTNHIVPLAAATSLENLRALNEVSDFATTDMGLGGPERWTYRILQEPALSTELQRVANPISIGGGGIDAIDFQPCQLHEFRTQDRKCIEHWQMASGGTWVFTAIFDGQCKYLLCGGGMFDWEYVCRARGTRHRGACVSNASLHDKTSARFAPSFVPRAWVPRRRLRRSLRLYHPIRPLHHGRLYPHVSRRACWFAEYVQSADPASIPRSRVGTAEFGCGDAMSTGEYRNPDTYGPAEK